MSVITLVYYTTYVPHRTLRLRHGMQAWYVRVCWPCCVRGGGEALESAVDMVVVDSTVGLRRLMDGALAQIRASSYTAETHLLNPR